MSQRNRVGADDLPDSDDLQKNCCECSARCHLPHAEEHTNWKRRLSETALPLWLLWQAAVSSPIAAKCMNEGLLPASSVSRLGGQLFAQQTAEKKRLQQQELDGGLPTGQRQEPRPPNQNSR
jgi:hypothetical protein